MLTRYIQTAMHHAAYSIQEDGTYFGEIPQLPDVWSHTDTLENCHDSLREVLEEWIIFALSHHQSIPEINGANLDLEQNDELTEEDLADIRVAREEMRRSEAIPWESVKAKGTR